MCLIPTLLPPNRKRRVWHFDSTLSLSVKFSITEEAMGVALLAPQAKGHRILDIACEGLVNRMFSHKPSWRWPFSEYHTIIASFFKPSQGSRKIMSMREWPPNQSKDRASFKAPLVSNLALSALANQQKQQHPSTAFYTQGTNKLRYFDSLITFRDAMKRLFRTNLWYDNLDCLYLERNRFSVIGTSNSGSVLTPTLLFLLSG